MIRGTKQQMRNNKMPAFIAIGIIDFAFIVSVSILACFCCLHLASDRCEMSVVTSFLIEFRSLSKMEMENKRGAAARMYKRKMH